MDGKHMRLDSDNEVFNETIYLVVAAHLIFRSKSYTFAIYRNSLVSGDVRIFAALVPSL